MQYIDKEIEYILENHEKDLSMNISNIPQQCRPTLFRKHKKIYNKLYSRYRAVTDKDYVELRNKKCKEINTLKRKMQKNMSQNIILV